MSVRLPSGEGYATQVAVEVQWLPRLTPRLPLPIPEPIAVGRPDETFPLPWSVRRWLPGSPATDDDVGGLERLAVDLAGLLTSLQRIDPSGGPSPGPRNGFRGGALATHDVETTSAIETRAGEIDADRAMATWRATRGDVVGSASGVGARRRHRVKPADR